MSPIYLSVCLPECLPAFRYVCLPWMCFINLSHNNLSSLQIKKTSYLRSGACPLPSKIGWCFWILKRKLLYIYRVQGSWSNFPRGLSPGNCGSNDANDSKSGLTSVRHITMILPTHSHICTQMHQFQVWDHAKRVQYLWNSDIIVFGNKQKKATRHIWLIWIVG